jgi:microcompartment protein CcmK/EutM
MDVRTNRGNKKVFLGIIQCEMELDRVHQSFEGQTFFLIEPQHEVDWNGPVIAVDTVNANVGDWVLVAQAPFGPQLDVPEDLPLKAAVVGVVNSITTLSEDDELEPEPETETRKTEEGRRSRSRGRGRRGRSRDDDRRGGRDDGRRGGRDDDQRGGGRDSDPGAKPQRKEERTARAAAPEPEAPAPREELDEPAPFVAETPAPEPASDPAPQQSEAPAEATEPGIVWDSGSSSGTSTVKGKTPRRRR